MKSPARTFALATIFAALCGIVLFSAATTPAGAAEPGGKAEAAAGEIDKTLAPYFVVQSMDGGEQPGPDAFPLKGTAVEARIAGVIAEVEVRQTYANAGSGALEARYIFPASTRAAARRRGWPTSKSSTTSRRMSQPRSRSPCSSHITPRS